MNKAIGIALLVAGVLLLVFGFQESHSFGSDVSRFFTGNPTDRSLWLIVGGALALVAGLVISATGWRRR
jgi:hypothetical protein